MMDVVVLLYSKVSALMSCLGTYVGTYILRTYLCM